MRRLFRIIIVVFLLLVIGAAAVPFVVPVDTMKTAVLTRIEAATGREVSMGKMSLSVFPTLAFRVENVTIGNPSWAGTGNMANIKMMRVGVELMPLLHKEVRLKEFTLESPTITLVKRGDQVNWQMGAAGGAKPVSTPAASPERGVAPVAPGQLSLGQITIKNGVATYHDFAQPAIQAFSDINLSLSAPDPDKSATLTGSAVYNGNKANIDLSLTHPLDVLSGKPAAISLKATYGTFDVTYKGTLARRSGIPDIAGTLDIREIDVSALGSRKDAGPANAAPAESGQGNKAPWSDAPIKLDGLKSANADLAITIGKLILPRTTLGDINAKVQLKDGVLSLGTNDIPAYDGTVKFALKASAANAVSLAAVVTGVKAEPLLHDFAHYDNLTGKLNAHLSVTASGGSERAMVSTLAGQGDFALKDGSLRGHNIAQMARNIGSAFQGGTDQKSTDFSDVTGTFTIKGGVVANNDLKMDSPGLRVTGAGTADLPGWQVNYMLKPTLVASLEGQGGKDASGIVVPIKINGPLNAPSYKPDLQDALKENLGDPSKLKGNVKNLKNQLNGLLR